MKERILNVAKDYRSALYVLFAVGLVVLFDLSFFNRYFPLTEGWWETYGYLINNGLVPYRDFDLAFPPLVPLIFAKALQLFGPDFYLFRIFGIALHATVVSLLVWWLRQYFSVGSAAAAVVLGSFFAMSNSTYIAKDYHIFVDLLLASALALTAYGIAQLGGSEVDRKRQSLVRYMLSAGTIAFGGASMVTLALVKQNIGILFAVGLVAGVFMLLSLRKSLFVTAMLFVGGLLAIGSAQFFLDNWSASQFLNLTLHNDAKGSMFAVLTRIVTDPINRHVVIYAVLAFYLILFVKGLFRIVALRELAAVMRRPYISLHHAALLYGLTLATFFVIYWGRLITLVIPIALAVIVSLLFGSISGVHKKGCSRLNIAISLPALLLLAYANTTTASFNFAGMYIPIVFALAVVADRTVFTPASIRTSIIVASTILCIIVARKWIMPYEWWGYEQGSIFQAKYETGYPELRGMYVDEDTRDAFALIKQSVDKYSHSSNDVLFYPSIPIFYLLSHKFPPFNAVVQWFDVITDKQARAMLNEFAQKRPHVIVFLDPPDFVYEGHSQLRQEPLVQSDIRSLMIDAVRRGEYELIATKVLENKMRRKIGYATSPVTVEVLNDKLIGKEWTALCGSTPCDPSRTSITTWRRRNGVATEAAGVLQKGDILSLLASEQAIDHIVESAGLQAKQNRYLLQVFVRKSTK